MKTSRPLALFALMALSFAEGFAPQQNVARKQTVSVQASNDESSVATGDFVKGLAFSALLGFSMLMNPLPAAADGQTTKFKLPPIDVNDKSRCSFSSSSIGQANAARDKLYDLRQCSLPNSKAPGFDLSGVIMTGTDVSGSNFKEAYFSKAYLHESNFDGADFTNAIVDRASFKGSSLKGTIFTNAVLTGTSFEDANVENTDFSEAYIGDFDIRFLCKNPTLKGENPVTGMDTRLSAGCKN
ncbi:thylakoid lumenal 17.4 kDa protein [Seminavis robusta]|uniref:Thylakoid lumenal 17.4 kDa protein n=1 Tax=Seminavis robusta TaxID=568900 RepID=A0A9N8DDV3_9STRA|nr:thylakoid lumenal 17.4 kDa protein [Seminavis robusta]|eukprot:Sro43_g026220.1 thylakoid lumenal 17.4 kDa protein (241) ;mRNA; f:85201-86036